MEYIKFSYLWQHIETGRFTELIWTLEELETGTQAEQCNYDWRRKYKLIARRLFTGLKDKNGKEIFESDILGDNSFEDDTRLWRGAVIWHNAEFCIESQHTMPTTLVVPIREYAPETECEIIGNIYENPELLEVSDEW